MAEENKSEIKKKKKKEEEENNYLFIYLIPRGDVYKSGDPLEEINRNLLKKKVLVKVCAAVAATTVVVTVSAWI